EEILRLVKELDLEKQIRFLGYFPDKDIPHLVDQSKALIYMSYYEGFGLPAIEAVARGISVITSDIVVMHESINEYGVFVDPNNENDIANVIMALYLRDSMSKSSDGSIIKNFNWANSARTVSSAI
ncbi:MAG: glycosyltransferase, partial [Candidatus Roizmanbacteria bacterium]